MASDDDFFSDDDLDNIPTNTLDQLEQQAVYTSTQKSAVHIARQPPAPLRKQAHNAASLNRAGGSGLNRNLPWRPPQPSRPSTQQFAHVVANAPPASAPDPPSSDYGLDDEEVINPDEPSMVIQPASRPTNASRQSYQNRQPARQASKKDVDLEAEAAFAAADAELGSQSFTRWPRAAPVQSAPNGGSMDVSAMLARIQELEAEQDRLRLAEEAARNEALAKQGEIAIVRSNQEKEKKQFDARLSVMQKLHADESARQKAEIDASRKERERMETDNRFLQHDLAQEAERAKRSAGTRRVPTQRDTPRKNKRTGLGDGFDDTELQPSPSKSREKGGDHTPKIGAKRKRPANDSPVAALSFTQPHPVLRKDSTEQTNGSSFGPPVVETVVVHDETKYKYIHQILNHTPREGHQRTVEALIKYSFPSSPDRTLASIFHDDLSRSSDDDDHLPSKLARICLRLWAGCLQDRYFSPFYLILDMLFLALYGELSSNKAKLIEEAVPLCCRTIDYIAMPAARAFKGLVLTKEETQTRDLWIEQLDVDSVLELLDNLCGAASLSSERNEVFWKTIDFQFVLQTLGRAQPMSHNITMLGMLSTSARLTTFGAIMGDADADPEAQPQQERMMIERLTVLLFEKFKAPKDEPPYTEIEILHVHVGVLKVFRAMCLTDHGTLLLSQHRSTTGRLIRFLDAQVSRLYSQRPSLGMPHPENTPHSLTIQLVNTTTRLLYHIIRAFDYPTVLIQKLRVVHLGYHKFLVCLTRIAFSEQLVYEAGIEDEVCEAAHDILDTILGPEDGEAVQKAMETPRGTKGSTTEKATSDGDDTTMSEPG